jgi:hypothetical protein
MIPPRIESLLHPLRRFVMGVGGNTGLQNGFVLSHPKLADFLREEYFTDPDPINRSKMSFVEWGRDTLEQLRNGTMKESPPYLLQHYVTHLRDIGASSSAFMAIVDRGWLDAWQRFEGGSRGFARDVQEVEAAVRREFCDAKFEWRLRCQLALCSIANKGANVPSPVIAANVSRNLISNREALHIARQQPSEQCADSLRLLLPSISDSLLLEAIDVACKLKGTYIGLAVMLCQRVLSCPERDRGVIVLAAISCINNLVSGRQWGHLFNQLYPLLPPIERGSAISMARTKAISDERRNIPPPFYFTRGEQRNDCVGALASIAPNLAQHFDDFSELTDALPAITGVLCRLEYGAVITSFLPFDQATSVVNSLLSAAKRYEAECDEDRARMDLDKSSPLEHNSGLAAITPALVGRPTDISAALAAAETIQDPSAPTPSGRCCVWSPTKNVLISP